MNLKEELQKLYPGWRIYGPYRRTDGRHRLILAELNAEGKHLDGMKKLTPLVSRAMMEVHLGRKLSTDEEVDHIDGNPLNDTIENLRVLDPISHAKHTWKMMNPGVVGKIEQLTCAECGCAFQRRANKLKKASKAYFCSKSCLGKWCSSKRKRHNQYSDSSKS